MIKMLLTGLPVTAVEENVATAMGKLGPVGKVTVIREGAGDTVWAIVEMDITTTQATNITNRVNNLWYEEHSITINVLHR